jgi:tRNA A-37 threonylcarbamoyl transferase component Bud32
LSGRGTTSHDSVAVGELIADRYRVESAVARGGMAEVFVVKDSSKGTRLALKRLRADVSDDARIATLFRLEFHTLARLSHPNIVEVYEYGVDHGRAFYTMEWLAGTDLGKLAPLPADRACALLRDVAAALSLLHTRRLLHRDVGPRNVRLTDSGCCKLLDFGAMAHFGAVKDIVGTPPMVAPECLRGGVLDQRTDLFALGALAYYLLTGRHAYAAKDFTELPERWRQVPPPPSASAPTSSSALDDLVLSLLRLDPAGRPPSAAFVIDRLVSIAGLPPEHSAQAGESYLESAVLAGREREQLKLRGALQEALAGRGTAVMIESNPGVGKSRLLQDFASEAQLAGALVAEVDARGSQGSYGVAQALCLALARAAPVEYARAFSPYAPTLGHVLREPAVSPGDLAELPADFFGRRSALQLALLQAVTLLAKARPLALIIDDVDRADDASLILLNALAHVAPKEALLLVTSQTLASTLAENAALATLNRAARHTRLHRFTKAGTAAWVHNIFGDVPNAERFAAFLHEATTGTAAQLAHLIRHLVDQGLVAYVGGTWALPAALPDTTMPDIIVAALRARAKHLQPAARTLADMLALYEGPMAIDVLAHAAGMTDADLFSALQELTSAGFITSTNEEHRLTQDAFRQVLRAELGAARGSALHLRIADALRARAATSADHEIRLGHHLILGGEDLVGAQRLDKAADRLAYEGVDLVPAMRAVESALSVHERRGRPWGERVRLRIKLVLWSPFTDAGTVERYADGTLEELYQYTGLATAEKLRWLGRGSALGLGVLGAALRNLLSGRTRRALTVEEAIVGFLRVLTPAIAVRAIRMDTIGVHRLTRYIAPLAGFPRRHSGLAIFVYARGQEQQFRGHVYKAKATFREYLALADSPGYLQGSSAAEAREMRFAGRVSLAQVSMRHGDPALVDLIEHIADDGAVLGVMTQWQMRAMFHMVRGEWEPAQRALHEFERVSAEVGDIWQMEQMMLPFTGLVAFVSGDTVALKRVVERLRVIGRTAPSLARIGKLIHASYLTQHGRAAEVVQELQDLADRTPPLTDVLWMDIHSQLAFAHLQLGHAQQAATICEGLVGHARGEMPFSDVAIVFVHWTWAEALLSLARPEAARSLLDGLLTEIEGTKAPLLLGRTYGLRALARQRLGDSAGFASDLAQMRDQHERSGHPLLLAQSARFAQAPAPATLRSAPSPRVEAGDDVHTSQLTPGVRRRQ